MLVLTRKVSQKIAIGGDVHVTVLSIDGDKVKIGIDAPKSIRVFREELIDATREQNRKALESAFISFTKGNDA